jgi:hypothetical protein
MFQMLGECFYQEVGPLFLGGFLSMDLTHTHIPMGDGTFEILYSRERAEKHVMDPNSPDYTSECDFDVPHQIIEYDPWDLPFVHRKIA